MALNFPTIFLLPTHLASDELGRLEVGIPSLTYNVREARVVLGNITRRERALFELRRLKLPTEPVEGESGPHKGRPAAGRDSSPTDTATIPHSEYDASSKRRRLSLSEDSHVPLATQHLEGPFQDGSSDMVDVVKLSWFTDCVNQGMLLPLDRYLLYRGRKLPSTWGAERLRKRKSPPKPPSTARSILDRAALDGHGSDQPHKHGQSRPPPTLLHRSTSDLETPPPAVPDYLHTTYSCERPTPGNSPNAPFIEELKNIRTLRLLQGDQIGVRAYSTSIAALAAYPYKLQGALDVERLPGCGTKIAGLYQQWKETGKTKETLDAASDPRLKVLGLFHEIWGVGDTTAREFYRKGWRDLDDIVEFGWESLSRVQQIGVKFYDELQLKIPRQEVEAIAGVILAHARRMDAGFEMAIVGGYRRGKEQSGDVDVVLSHRDECRTHNLIGKVVLSLEEGGFITHTLGLWTRNSERDQLPLPWRGQATGSGAGFDTLDKAMVVWQDAARVVHEEGGPPPPPPPPPPHRRVDIIVSPWRTVGCALLGWSGGTTFQRDLRRYCKREKGLKFDSSGIRRRSDGEWMDLESGPAADVGSGAGPGRQREPAPDMETAERRVFEGLGLAWRPPQERCTG